MYNCFRSPNQVLGSCFIYLPSTVCPRSSDSFYVVTYYMKWVTTSWTYCMQVPECVNGMHHKEKEGDPQPEHCYRPEISFF